MIKYLISSHIRYAPVTLPRLLASMHGIEGERIVVAVGGAATDRSDEVDGIPRFLVRHNSFDYTALIALLDLNLASDWWFWLHDTCECGSRFRDLAENHFDSEADMTAAYLHHAGGAQSNLGMYRHELFVRHRDTILALRDCSKQAACDAEGFPWKRGLGVGSSYPNSDCQTHPHQDVYGTGTSRLVEYYTAVDLYKYKANWGQPGMPVADP